MAEIFLSWSGEASRQIATVLRELLPVILRIPSPFMSDKDIEKGRQWREDLDNKLRETSHGMFILTPENIAKRSEWMAYEAGAVISTKAEEIRVFTLLFNVLPTSMPKYFSEFQFSSFKEDDWRKLLNNIKTSSAINSEEFGNFDVAFRLFWQDFEAKVNNILLLEGKKLASENSFLDDPSQKIAESTLINDREVIAALKSMQELSSFVVKIPSIETKINDLFEQFDSFQSRLASPLRETGLLTSQSIYPPSNEDRSRHRTSSIRRLQNIVTTIEEDGLLDANTLKELKSALEELT